MPTTELERRRSSRPRRFTTLRALQGLKHTVVPGLMEEVHVLWLVNGAKIWWRAEVTELIDSSIETTATNGAQKATDEPSTIAMIRYLPRRGYVAVDYKVAFLHRPTGMKKLMHISPSATGLVTWKYPEEIVQVMKADQLTRPRPSISKVTNTSRKASPPLSTSTRKTSSQRTPGEDNGVDVGVHVTGEVNGADVGVQSTATNAGASRVTQLTNTKRNNQSIERNAQVGEHVEGSLELNIPSEGNVTALIRSVINNGTVQRPLQTFILYGIKFLSLYRIGASMSKTKYQQSGVEGFDSREVIVNVCSDLSTFLDLVRPLHSDSEDTNGTESRKLSRFNPSYHSFQHPTRAMTDLSVDFADLPTMLKWMNINDIHDHRSFATKASVRRSERVLRILGTKCTISVKKSVSGTGRVDVDCVLPFVSCTRSQISQLEEFFNNTSTNSNATENCTHIINGIQTNLVFFRYRDNYDACQGRFLSPWRARRVNWCFFGSTPQTSTASIQSSSNRATSSSTTTESDTSFTVQWCRSATLPASTWTEDATFMGSYVMGNISVFFPSVVFFGASTVAEIQALLDRHC